MYFKREVFRHAKGRRELDGRLIVPEGSEPRDVVEAILLDALSDLNVKLISNGR